MSNLSKTDQTQELVASGAPLGFEDEGEDDMIIPRVKMIQSLSPERKEKLAEEGDIINSLTLEKYNGKTFVPVFKFNSNIRWKDRNDGGGIACIARNGKHGTESDGTELICSVCRKNEWDNTKQGKEAIPSCTKYINFFGFFEGDRMPIILSFAKTNYNEGKKLFSLAKVSMQNMWHNGYRLDAKLKAKASNEWYIIDVASEGATSEDDRAFGMELFKSFRNSDLIYDVDERIISEADNVASDEEVESAEF